MTLAPLLDAPAAVQVHLVAALAALALGARQLVAAKGGAAHVRAGRAFVALVAVVALTGFLIHEIRVWGRWSPVHVLSAVTLAGLPVWVLAARRGAVRLHAAGMTALFLGGLVVAGAFTLWPGRRLGAALLGG